MAGQCELARGAVVQTPGPTPRVLPEFRHAVKRRVHEAGLPYHVARGKAPQGLFRRILQFLPECLHPALFVLTHLLFLSFTVGIAPHPTLGGSVVNTYARPFSGHRTLPTVVLVTTSWAGLTPGQAPPAAPPGPGPTPRRPPRPAGRHRPDPRPH